jgi:hypothetical protein
MWRYCAAIRRLGQVFLRIMEERKFPVDNLRKGAVLYAVRIAEEELNQDILAIRKVW